MKSKIKTICMFCGKDHKKTPAKCKFKSAIASSLMDNLHPKNRFIGMAIMDKSNFLKNAWRNFKAK